MRRLIGSPAFSSSGSALNILVIVLNLNLCAGQRFFSRFNLEPSSIRNGPLRDFRFPGFVEPRFPNKSQRRSRADTEHGAINWSYFRSPVLQSIAGPGPDNWARLGECSGISQSPINFDTFEIERMNPPRSEHFKFSPSYSVLLNDIRMFKDRGTVHLVPPTWTDLTVRGGGLNSEYKLIDVHFHWGSESFQGSEHTVDGRAFPAELHMVHIKNSFKNIGEALRSGDKAALSVFGVFLEESPFENRAFEFLNQLPSISPSTSRSSAVNLGKRLIAMRNLLPRDTSEFYRYRGGLTTPNCNEVVVWTVFKNPMKISSRQLGLLRKVYPQGGNYPIEDNWRPTQPLNGRNIFNYINRRRNTRLLF